MQDKERIARIGSFDLGSHLGIPFSHVSANNFRIDVTKRYTVRGGMGMEWDREGQAVIGSN